ncbi:glycosyltransferase [Clostridium estertheticum]|uniref:glycosyltransferase family 4 protein n=1 Tax=Clostridium estertheticum TaxID=238834 RepID=UPI001C7DD120|nr:glycosyltransferase [Clostridium estertheticum]MBX4261723.1 glycosyltransferase [Clostridium estertheticum]WLC68568.1 glycosyltransferase [Clostridium estertheticum]
MKVLLCVRQDYYRNFAVDSMKVIKTAEYLRKLGVTVDINDGGIYDYSSYDIVHLFNIDTAGETYRYYKIAQFYKKSLVISPMHWDMKKYHMINDEIESMKLYEKCSIYKEEILKRSKAIICNSELEKELIKSEFHVSVYKEVIYNGVEVENDDIPLYNFKERYNLNNYVLCVGRISQSKNQLALCRICAELGKQLVLIGNVNDNEYLKECTNFKNVVYLGFMDNYNVYNAYRFAKVHVNPSFVGMPGLSSLEAAASGCNVVSTKEGCAKEYFKEMAFYCDPYDNNSILSAVKSGFEKRKDNILKNYVNQNFNYDKLTNDLYKIYLEILN